MASNPLQKYFRQPKIFISLPSQGIYNLSGAIEGDVNKLAVYGMTGMDEIILKTADALLSGESTARVVRSCCPEIADPWDISMLDMDLILTAIRIATYGNELDSTRLCNNCGAENTYSINLSEIIEFYSQCFYNNNVKVGDLTVTIRPLTYKQSSDFSVKNFELQQRLAQINVLQDEVERRDSSKKLLESLSAMRYEIFSATIESVAIGTTVVTDRQHIQEWLSNADKDVTDAINKHIEKVKLAWTPPPQTTVCESCQHQEDVFIELDQSNFFVGA